MKRLIITRHAKSSWDNFNLADHDRTLNDRGRVGCKLIASWLNEHSFLPDEVISSTAVRCVETWEGIGLALSSTAPVDYRKGLYHSSADQILSILAGATSDTVMLIAHNPGIGDFAKRMCKTPVVHQKFGVYPTAATTVMDLKIKSWKDVSFHTGQKVHFVVPKELSKT